MTLPLTPAMLAGAYEYLRTTPPFRYYALRPAEEVEFAVTRHVDREGDYIDDPQAERLVIRVSENSIGSTDVLMQVIAHEMVHLRHGPAHGASFRRAAKRVCLLHGWDAKRFV